MAGFGNLPPVPSLITIGLPGPPDGPEKPGEWYEEALQLPPTYVSGWFGATLGGPRSDGDITLLFHSEHHLKPTLRLVMSQTELLAIFAGIGNLLHTRTNLLPQWSLTPLSGDGAPE